MIRILKSQLRSFFVAFLSVMALFFVAYLVLLVYTSVSSFITTPSKITILDHSSIVDDGVLTIYSKVDRYKAGCVLRTDRFLSKPNQPDLNVPLPMFERYIETTGTVKNTVHIPLPNKIDSGDWLYNLRVLYYCSATDYLFGPRVVKIDPIPFYVSKENKPANIDEVVTETLTTIE